MQQGILGVLLVLVVAAFVAAFISLWPRWFPGPSSRAQELAPRPNVVVSQPAGVAWLLRSWVIAVGLLVAGCWSLLDRPFETLPVAEIATFASVVAVGVWSLGRRRSLPQAAPRDSADD